MQNLADVRKIAHFVHNRRSYDTGIKKYPLLSKEELVKKAARAKEAGATSFCLVCAYRDPPEKDFQHICEAIKEISSKLDIEVNVSMGFLTLSKGAKAKGAWSQALQP